MKTFSIQNTISSIQTTLGCTTQKAIEVAKSLFDTKLSFDLDLNLAQLWEQEKPYIIKYGHTAFEAGYLGLLNITNK